MSEIDHNLARMDGIFIWISMEIMHEKKPPDCQHQKHPKIYQPAILIPIFPLSFPEISHTSSYISHRFPTNLPIQNLPAPKSPRFRFFANFQAQPQLAIITNTLGSLIVAPWRRDPGWGPGMRSWDFLDGKIYGKFLIYGDAWKIYGKYMVMYEKSMGKIEEIWGFMGIFMVTYGAMEEFQHL